MRAMNLALAVGWLAAAPVLAADARVTKYVRFEVGNRVSYGILEGDTVRELSGDLFGLWDRTERKHPVKEVKLLPPTRPDCKVLALARNYQSHAGEAGAPPTPEAFYKPSSCLVGDGEPIVIPPGTKEVHPEGELVIVIAKRARNVPESEAMAHVLGVTCGNDVSARDWQKNDIQWWRAKGSDTFGPCGPVITSGLDYDNLLLETRVNGKVMQKESTKHLVHGVAKLVSYISKFVTLEPGDLIYTGTPGTTGPIKAGDVVEIEIEGIGVLKNPVKAAE